MKLLALAALVGLWATAAQAQVLSYTPFAFALVPNLLAVRRSPGRST